MTAPRHIIASVPRDRLQAAMDSCAICACEAVALHGEPERSVGDITHGVLVCHRGPLGEIPPERCQKCGHPWNDADESPGGKCMMCLDDDYYDAEDYAHAEREAIKDWEDERGTR